MGYGFDGYAMYKGSGKFGKGFNEGKGKPSMNTYNMDLSYMPFYMLELQPLELFSTSQPSSSTSCPKTVSVGFGMLDTGATASAGPESSAKLLLFKQREIDPEIGVHMDYDQTPHFWHGSGQWGKAKCHLTITSSKDPLRSFQVYALSDPPGYVYGWSSSNMLVRIWLVWTSV
jgi:hypothetical protein